MIAKMPILAEKSVNGLALSRRSLLKWAGGILGALGWTVQCARSQDYREQHILKVQGGHVFCLAFSPDGKLIASGGLKSGTVQIWDAGNGKEKIKLTGPGRGVLAVAFTPDGMTLASCDNGPFRPRTPGSQEGIHLWDIVSGREKATFRDPDNRFQCVAISPDGKVLAAGGADKYDVRSWDLHTNKEFPLLKGHSSIVTKLAFSPDGKTLASSSFDGLVKLWDLQTGKEKASFTSPGARSVAFSPDGKLLATSGQTRGLPPAGEFKIWDLASGEQRLSVQDHSFDVRAVAFSPDGKTLASCGVDATVKLRDPVTGKERAVLKGHTGRVTCLAFAPDGKLLVSGGDDGTVRIWNMR